MIPFDTLLCNILLLVALALPGYWLGKTKKISDNSASCMGSILTDVAMPFLVFSKLLETDLTTIGLTDLLLCALFPLGLEPLLFFISKGIFNKKDNIDSNHVSTFCAIFSNCGFLGIPLAAALFPNHPQIVALVSLFNVFSSFMLLTLGVSILSNGKEKIKPLQIFCRPITLAILFGIVASLIHHHISPLSPLGQYASYLASLTTPLSMIVMGYEFSKFPFFSLFYEKKLYPTAAIKLLLSPCMTALILGLLRSIGIDVSTHTATALFIATAVSTAATAPAIARKYDSDARLATIQTLGTTILCIATLPLCYQLFNLLFHI